MNNNPLAKIIKALNENGLPEDKVQFDDEAIAKFIHDRNGSNRMTKTEDEQKKDPS